MGVGDAGARGDRPDVSHWLVKDALVYRLGAVTVDLEARSPTSAAFPSTAFRRTRSTSFIAHAEGQVAVLGVGRVEVLVEAAEALPQLARQGDGRPGDVVGLA